MDGVKKMNNKIIDVHAHILPENIVKNPSAFALMDDYFGYISTPTPANFAKQCFVTYEQAIKQMDKDGIDIIAIQGWPMGSYECCVMQNDNTLEAMKAYPDSVMGFCIVNPNDGINAIREVKRCLEAGMVGVGELDPYGQRFSLDNETLLKICDICVDYDVPLSIHISEPVGEFYFGKSNVPLNDYVNLIMKKPYLKVILPHWGGGLPFFELMPDIRKSFENVYYDMAASPLLCTPDIYENTINIVGAEKLLFGTDYPLVLYPDKEGEPGFANFLDEVKANISDEKNLNNILGNNFLRLLNKKEGGNLKW